MNGKRFIRSYMWMVIVAGAGAALYSAYELPLARLDLPFVLFAAFTLLVGPRFCIPIPRTTGQITVSDTFIFLTMLLYGGEAAVLLAAADLFAASRFGRWRFSLFTSVFNAAMMAVSTFVTFLTVRLLFGDVVSLPHGEFSGPFVVALCVMGLTQYIVNSLVAALHTSLKSGEALWVTWRSKYLWTSVTYFAGASAAGIIVKLADVAGFYALVAATPIIAIVYLTYRTYLENVEAMAAAAKAEAEAAARAEAAVTQAAQAERHVEELSHYIAEQVRIREQFTQIEKLSALGELASGVAHDFNNTLTGILGRAQLLLTTYEPEKIEAGLRLIIKTAKDGARTIKRIQDFARQRRGHDFQHVSMDQVLLDVREITRPRWKSSAEASNVHIKLELQLDSDNALVFGDESELREVLVNMVFNAVDAMPEGGTLTLSTTEVGGEIEVSVRDTGVGMSEEVRSRIFDPFFTTKGKAGMGLGLAVGYSIIRRHEGTIEVQSELGRGTSFRIRLPVAQGQPKSMPSPEPLLHAVAAEHLGQARILVIDDEEHVRALLRDILEREGCEVVLASGGAEALELFGDGKFDAVFTDIGMPGMSGWEFAHTVRQHDRNIPLAIITGWGDTVGSDEKDAAQVDWIVAKPFETDQIIGIAREVLRRREGLYGNAATVAA